MRLNGGTGESGDPGERGGTGQSGGARRNAFCYFNEKAIVAQCQGKMKTKLK